MRECVLCDVDVRSYAKLQVSMAIPYYTDKAIIMTQRSGEKEGDFKSRVEKMRTNLLAKCKKI